jgi:hypothetical protein
MSSLQRCLRKCDPFLYCLLLLLLPVLLLRLLVEGNNAILSIAFLSPCVSHQELTSRGTHTRTHTCKFCTYSPLPLGRLLRTHAHIYTHTYTIAHTHMHTSFPIARTHTHFFSDRARAHTHTHTHTHFFSDRLCAIHIYCQSMKETSESNYQFRPT